TCSGSPCACACFRTDSSTPLDALRVLCRQCFAAGIAAPPTRSPYATGSAMRRGSRSAGPDLLPGAMNAAPNFDRLDRVYRWLELVTFGNALSRCRSSFLDEL